MDTDGPGEPGSDEDALEDDSAVDERVLGGGRCGCAILLPLTSNVIQPRVVGIPSDLEGPSSTMARHVLVYRNGVVCIKR